MSGKSAAKSKMGLRIALSAIFPVFYLCAYLAITFLLSPQVRAVTPDGRKITVFCFLPAREVLVKESEEWSVIDESGRVLEEGGEVVRSRCEPALLERPLFFVFYPMLILEKSLGSRLYEDFVLLDSDGRARIVE